MCTAVVVVVVVEGGAHSSGCHAQYLSTEPALLMEPARAMLEAR